MSDELQFGFKRKLSYVDVIFMLRATIDCFSSKGSTVYLASLDTKKALDSVVHDKLFAMLESAGYLGQLSILLGIGTAS